MSVHTFTLVLEGSVSDQDRFADQLFEAGCDDALLLERDGVYYLDFDRDAATMLDAVVSAVRDVNGAGAGVRVLRVGPDDRA